MSLDAPINDKQIKVAPAKKFFIFPGDGIWHPERIEAETREAAEEVYHKIKKLITSPQEPKIERPEQELQ